MIKILQILNDSNIGGAGKLLYNISSCIDREQYEFVFVFPENSKLIKRFIPLGFKIYAIDCVPDTSFDIKSLIKIIKIIKKERPQIVHTHSSLSGKLALKLSGCNTIKSIYTKHCVFGVPKIMKIPAIKKLHGSIDDLLSDKIIAVADVAKHELIESGIKSNKICVIVNGSKPLKQLPEKEKANLRKKLGIKKDEFTVGISARLEWYKGHKYLIKAAKKSVKNHKKIKFLIMGDGSYRKVIEEYSHKLGVDKNMIFLGFVDDVTSYMNIFDVNVNCSIGTETSSLSISEGLSLGIPAIVSNYGGNPNMVINGKTGYVINKADPDELYAAICKLSSNRHLYNSMRCAAIKDFNSRFSHESMTRKYEIVYKDLIYNNNACRN